MIFVWTFAVGGGSGTEIPFPTWALVCNCDTVLDVSDSCPVEPRRKPRLLQASNGLVLLGPHFTSTYVLR